MSVLYRKWHAGLAAILWLACATEVSARIEPQPILRLNLSKQCPIKLWQGENTPILHRTAKGQLALLPGQYSLGKPRHALLSDDQGRTWHAWSESHAWPKMAYVDVVRLGDEMLAFGHNDMDCYKGTYVWRSKDDGLTWTGGKRLTPDADRWAPMNQRMLLSSRGRLILPIEQLLGAEGPDPNQIGTIYSDDAGRSWKRSPLFGPPPPLPDRPEGFGEPATVELSDGRIWMVFRTRYGHLWQAWSADGGATWGKASPTQLVSPASAVNAKRLPGSNAVIVFWNHAKPGTSTNWNASPNLWRPRSPLVFATSQDGCKTWSRPVVIDPGTAAYPSICFSDREMFVAYWADPDPNAVFLNPKSDLMLVVYELPSLLRFAREESADQR